MIVFVTNCGLVVSRFKPNDSQYKRIEWSLFSRTPNPTLIESAGKIYSRYRLILFSCLTRSTRIFSRISLCQVSEPAEVYFVDAALNGSPSPGFKTI